MVKKEGTLNRKPTKLEWDALRANAREQFEEEFRVKKKKNLLGSVLFAIVASAISALVQANI